MFPKEWQKAISQSQMESDGDTYVQQRKLVLNIGIDKNVE